MLVKSIKLTLAIGKFGGGKNVKKTIKIVGAAVVLMAMLLVLVGCGSDRVVATRDGEGYTERMEIVLENGRIGRVTTTYEFEDDEEADMQYEIMNLMFPEDGIVSRDGNAITMVMDERITRDELIEELEDQGFTVR